MVLLFFSHLLLPSQLDRVLAQRLGDIDATLTHIDTCLERDECSAHEGAVFATGFARAMLTAGRDYIEQHREGLLRASEKKEMQS